MSLPADAEPPRPPGAKMPPRDVADQLFLCETYPTAFLSTPKCGSTFVKHLFWQIDHARAHETATGDGTRIHSFDLDLPRGDRVTLDWVAASVRTFCIVREPADRIFSLYWDKLARTGDRRWAWFRELMAGYEDYAPAPETPAEHRRNCEIMVEWIGANLRGETEVRLNNHWRPQQMRINMARTLSLKALPLDRLEDRLVVLLGDLIPDLRARMDEVGARNVVPRAVPADEMTTDWLKELIGGLYWADATAWEEAQAGWAALDLSRPDPEAVPRFETPYV